MPANEILAVGMFISFIALVFTGFPVAWLLGGLAIVFSALAVILEADFQLVTGMNWDYTSLTVERIWNVMENWVMVALPMFILMGLLLDRSGIANQLMSSFARLFGNLHGGPRHYGDRHRPAAGRHHRHYWCIRCLTRLARPARHAATGLR